MLKYLMVLFVLILSGCIGSPVSNTTKSSEAKTKLASDMQADILETPQVLGNGNTFKGNVSIGNIPQTKRKIESKLNNDMETSYSMATKVSFAFACFFFACSLMIAAVAIPILIRTLGQSKALKATATLVDSGIASAVNMAATSTDHASIASAHNTRAILEGLKKHL